MARSDTITSLDRARKVARSLTKRWTRTPAQRRAMLAIELNGGEICEMRYGERSRWVAMDHYGGEVARFDPRTMRSLSQRGDLTLKRFAFGGAVYGLNNELVQAAAFAPKR